MPTLPGAGYRMYWGDAGNALSITEGQAFFPLVASQHWQQVASATPESPGSRLAQLRRIDTLLGIPQHIIANDGFQFIFYIHLAAAFKMKSP